MRVSKIIAALQIFSLSRTDVMHILISAALFITTHSHPLRGGELDLWFTDPMSCFSDRYCCLRSKNLFAWVD